MYRLLTTAPFASALALLPLAVGALALGLLLGVTLRHVVVVRIQMFTRIVITKISLDSLHRRRPKILDYSSPSPSSGNTAKPSFSESLRIDLSSEHMVMGSELCFLNSSAVARWVFCWNEIEVENQRMGRFAEWPPLNASASLSLPTHQKRRRTPE